MKFNSAVAHAYWLPNYQISRGCSGCRSTPPLNPLWNSKADKILKLKFVVKFIVNAWANSNTWANLVQIHGQMYGHPQMHGQPLSAWSKCCINAWSIPNANAFKCKYIVKCECIISIIECNVLSNAMASSALLNANTLSNGEMQLHWSPVFFFKPWLRGLWLNFTLPWNTINT